MKHITNLLHSFKSFWKKQSLAQKITLGYFCILMIALVTLPILKVTAIADDSSESFKLFNSYMRKIALVIFLAIAKLSLWNIWETYRNRIYAVFGFQASIPLMNFFVLSICFLLFLAIVDTVSFTQYHLSQHIMMSRGWAVIAVLLFIGMIWQLVIARLQWKQKIRQHEVQSYHSQQSQQQEFFVDKQAQEKLL